LKKILNLMIENAAHNDDWTVTWMTEVYRKPSGWIPHRHLAEEYSIHHIQSRKHSKCKGAIKDSITQGPVDAMQKFGYMQIHMPKDFRTYLQRRQLLIIAMGVCLFCALCRGFFNESHPYLSVSLILVASVLMSNFSFTFANVPLPSYLALEELPDNMRKGLLIEIDDCIQGEIDNAYHALQQIQLSLLSADLEDSQTASDTETASKAPATPTSSPAIPHSEKSSETTSNTVTTSKASAIPTLSAATETVQAKALKQKTRPAVSSSTYVRLNAELNNVPTFSWDTQQYGTITFQPGRVEHLIALWSTDKKLCGLYVVLFLRDHLEEAVGVEMTNAFKETAYFGRIVRKENQTGFVKVSDEEKRNGDNKLPANTIFKIKTFRQGYERYRAPVVPCKLNAPAEHELELLVVLPPIRTHAGRI
jgi:hypothetical protein